ncbi:MAG: cytochrome ubiquinol oxidase subunit I [Beutenbergiaceae bacterium]
MEALDVARWQFAIVTVYHFIFVPLTIGLAPLVATMQTAWLVTGKDHWLRLTKFFGKLLLVNFAVGVVTGIVQEFQFGMNWSEYSRFVGDIFGAPLAIEGLAAFFLESTFLGLWIFGWDKLPRKIHLACIWLVALGTNLSAAFILAANSWMQHPVGARYNPETGRAELTDFGAVLTNNTFLAAYSHTIATALLVAGTFVVGVGGWLMVREARAGKAEDARTLYRPAVLLGLVTVLAAGVGVAGTGDWQAKLMFDQQPLKMAAAEALCETEVGADFSILTVGDLSDSCEGVIHVIKLPGVTSFLADGDFTSTVQGVPELEQVYADRYGSTDASGATIDYSPNLAITYWSFRLMIGLGAVSAVLALTTLWLLRRKGSVTDKAWFGRLCLVAIPMPFAAACFGWIFTEAGRQPWVVVPNPTGVDMVRMLTADGVSSSVSTAEVITSLLVFTALYTVLAVVWVGLMRRYASHGAVPVAEPPDPDDQDSGKPLSFAY